MDFKDLRLRGRRGGWLYKPVVFTGYHSTVMGGLPSHDVKLGIHIGTKQAAYEACVRIGWDIERQYHSREEEIKGRLFLQENCKLIPVRVTLHKPFGSLDSPRTDRLQTMILTEQWIELPGSVLKEPAYPLLDKLLSEGCDGIVYTNEVEDIGSISIVAFYRKSIEVLDGTSDVTPDEYEDKIGELLSKLHGLDAGWDY